MFVLNDLFLMLHEFSFANWEEFDHCVHPHRLTRVPFLQNTVSKLQIEGVTGII